MAYGRQQCRPFLILDFRANGDSEQQSLSIFRTLLRLIILVSSNSIGAGKFRVSLTILYRHPRRPDEAGMTVVSDQTKATVMKAQLEHRGYLVTKIVTATFAKAIPAI